MLVAPPGVDLLGAFLMVDGAAPEPLLDIVEVVTAPSYSSSSRLAARAAGCSSAHHSLVASRADYPFVSRIRVPHPQWSCRLCDARSTDAGNSGMSGTGHSLEHLMPVERTLLLTLCGRAADAESTSPVLGDTTAVAVAATIDEAARSAAGDADLAVNVALRTVEIDRHVHNFLTAHTDAVVLELGCGLETRPFRLTLPSGVDFYSIDLPAVIELRRRLLPAHERETTIASRLEGPEWLWLDTVPRHRPAIIVADGVLTFLDPDEAVRLVNRLTEHIDHGELVCQANTTFLTRDLGRVPELRAAGIESPYRGFGIDEPTDMERLAPGLRFVEEFVLARQPEHFHRFSPRFRTILQVLRLRIRWARLSTWVLRYRF